MDSKQKQLIYIRFCYWLGAILDGLMAIDMTLYMFFNTQVYLGLPHPSDQTQLALRYGTGLMIGWTILLIWGVQKPIERRDLLIITVFPVIISGVIYEIIFFSIGNQFLTLNGLILSNIIPIPLSVIFIYAFIIAKNLNQDNSIKEIK